METRSSGARSDQARLQPRPALGLRPWFALLRRARSLRRFAFAIAGRVTTAHSYRPMVALRCDAWRVDRVVVANTFLARLLGIHAAGATGVLLRSSSVHGMSLAEPLSVTHLTRAGAVVSHDRLEAGGRVRASGYWMLELPLDAAPPPPGARLTVLPSSPR
jgi:hypothetical protein